MGMEHAQPSYMREALGETGYASDIQDVKAQPIREVDNLLDLQEKQIQFMVETMRRIEDLADRIDGPAPCGTGTEDKELLDRNGYLGALQRQHIDRDKILGRISEAMLRIERMI